MIREALAEDRAAIEAFLNDRIASSMFLCSNLAAHGIGWSDHPHSTRVFLWMRSDGIAGIFGLTRGGFLLAQAPGAPPEAYEAFARAIAGETVIGMTGLSDQVSATLSALGLDKAAFNLNHEEPLCRLSLDRLTDDTEDLRPASVEHLGLLTDWFLANAAETGVAATSDSLEDRARTATKPRSRVCLLFEDKAPVAMAAINAKAHDHVQVGGVFVPPENRNRGFGRRVTKALLIEARAKGARTAILFSNNDAATRAYEAIGFRQIATFRIALLSAPETVGMTA